MEAVFVKVVNLSISAGWLVLAVMVLRLVFRRAPKWIFCLLWGLVALRLVCPLSLESALSLIPSAQTLPPEIVYTAAPRIDSGIGAIDRAVNPVLAQALTPQGAASANPTQVWSFLLSRVWVLGIAVMALYALVSCLLLRRRVGTATLLRDQPGRKIRGQSSVPKRRGGKYHLPGGLWGILPSLPNGAGGRRSPHAHSLHLPLSPNPGHGVHL